jgi:hypothetical protein
MNLDGDFFDHRNRLYTAKLGLNYRWGRHGAQVTLRLPNLQKLRGSKSGLSCLRVVFWHHARHCPLTLLSGKSVKFYAQFTPVCQFA